MHKVINIKELERKYENILLGIYPFFLIINPKLSNNILVVFLLILIGMKIYLRKKIIFSKYELFLGLFIFSILISIWFKNIDINNDYTMLFRHIRWLIYPLLLGQIDLDYKKIKLMLISASVGILGYGFRLFEEVKRVFNFSEKINLSQILNHRYMGQWSIPQTAMIMGASFFMFYFIAAMLKNKRDKTILYIVSLLSFIILLSTQSRGMTLTVIIISVLMGVFIPQKEIRFLSVGIVGLSLIGCILFSKQGYVKRYENLSKDTSSLARIEIYKEAIRIFKENKITGIGFEGFEKAQNPKEYRYIDYYWHPHNMALKMLSETGIIGFIFYYLFMGNTLFMLYQNYKKNKYCFVGILVVISLLLYENIETMMIKDIALPYIFFIIAVCLNLSYIKDKK